MLALVGSGEYLPPMKEVDRYLLDLLPDQPRLVCLATAAGQEGEQRLSYWNNLGVSYFSELGAEATALPVIDRISASNDDFVEKIRQANFVYLSGGNPVYLFNTLQGTPAWQAILDVHQNGGVVAGCSAGAMVMGDLIPALPRWKIAFNLLPGMVVIPHFDEISPALVWVVRLLIRRDKTLLGIEGNTAFIVLRDVCEVRGKGSVTLWNRLGKRRFRHGQIIERPEALPRTARL